MECHHLHAIALISARPRPLPPPPHPSHSPLCQTASDSTHPGGITNRSPLPKTACLAFGATCSSKSANWPEVEEEEEEGARWTGTRDVLVKRWEVAVELIGCSRLGARSEVVGVSGGKAGGEVVEEGGDEA